MPILSSGEKNEQIFLPSTKYDKDGNELPKDQQGWVVMDVSPMRAGDLAEVRGEMADGEVGIAILADRIKEWNFTDAANVTLPITPETVSLFSLEDYRFLQSKVLQVEEGLSTEEKKSLNPTLPDDETIKVRVD